MVPVAVTVTFSLAVIEEKAVAARDFRVAESRSFVAQVK